MQAGGDFSSSATGLLGSKPVSDEQRERNNLDNRPLLVLAVLAVLAVYCYLFTRVTDLVHLPRPQHQLAQVGIRGVAEIFSDDGTVDSELRISQFGLGSAAEPTPNPLRGHEGRMLLFLVVAGAFLSTYYLPVRHKQANLVLWCVLAVASVYGSRAVCGLLAAHGLVYLTLHPASGTRALRLGASAGVLAYLTLAPPGAGLVAHGMYVAACGALSAVAYRYGLVPLLAGPRGPLLRTVAVQSALLVVCTGALVEGIRGATWALPLGILLFFWHWERLMMYHVDYKDGQVPRDVTLAGYLSVFLTPAMVGNWNWGVTIGQGYAYTTTNFLQEDKNRLIVGGLKIWGVALLYLIFGDLVIPRLQAAFASIGVPVFQGNIQTMACHYAEGGRVGTASVLATTILDQTRWLLLWGGIVHFKVGTWRICGYRMDPYFNRPWTATNLISFWTRFTFHYREFLVRVFYYPVFFRYFRKHRTLRIFAATFAAVGLGNLVWGHIVEQMYYSGMRFQTFSSALKIWPYFVLLSLGISITEIYLLRKKRTRAPWSRDAKIVTDVLAVYCTIQFYSLVHVFFYYCDENTLWDTFCLFMLAFGIDLA